MSTIKAKAYAYVRFSTPEQAQGDSRRRQTDAAERYAERHNLDIDTELNLADEGVSAFRSGNAQKGALSKFMEAVEKGAVLPGSILLVEQLDRVSRDEPLLALMLMQSLIQKGITIVTLADGKVFNGEMLRKEPFLLMQAVMMMTMANIESANKSRRLKEAWQNKRNLIKIGRAHV